MNPNLNITGYHKEAVTLKKRQSRKTPMTKQIIDVGRFMHLFHISFNNVCTKINPKQYENVSELSKIIPITGLQNENKCQGVGTGHFLKIGI